MTIASLLIGTFTSQVIFVLLKVFFFKSLDLSNSLVIALFYIVFVIAIIAIVRRLGILNYLESIFLSAVWLITSLIVDAVITGTVVGYDMYKTWTYWLSLLVMIVVVMSFHKKQHVEVRKASK